MKLKVCAELEAKNEVRNVVGICSYDLKIKGLFSSKYLDYFSNLQHCFEDGGKLGIDK